jgi:hypothetical protein
MSFRDEVPHFSGEASYVLLCGALIITATLLLFRRRFKYLLIVLAAPLLSIGSLFWTASSVKAWAGHHVFYSHIILFVGLTAGIYGLLPKMRAVACILPAAILASTLNSLWRIAHSTPDVLSDLTRGELFKVVDEPVFASQYIVVHTQWGTYFIDALFGPQSQAVTWVEAGMTPDLDNTATKAGRKLAFITLANPGWGQASNGRKLVRRATSSSGKWELWAEP